jgi:hypothetical protein
MAKGSLPPPSSNSPNNETQAKFTTCVISKESVWYLQTLPELLGGVIHNVLASSARYLEFDPCILLKGKGCLFAMLS